MNKLHGDFKDEGDKEADGHDYDIKDDDDDDQDDIADEDDDDQVTLRDMMR